MTFESINLDVKYERNQFFSWDCAILTWNRLGEKYVDFKGGYNDFLFMSKKLKLK